MSEEKKPAEDWMNKKWRPMMGWTYMGTCIADFVVFPILWSLLQAVLKQPVTAWQPLTLQGAGLYHVAMGAVLGIAAFGRTQEKMAGASTVPTTVPAPISVSTPSPAPITATLATPAPVSINTELAGKKAPPQPEQPLL